MYDQEIRHKLKLKFSTVPNDPNDTQLELIKLDITALVAKGSTPTWNDWAKIVKRYCPSAGTYIYKGVGTSDLIRLLQLATKN